MQCYIVPRPTMMSRERYGQFPNGSNSEARIARFARVNVIFTMHFPKIDKLTRSMSDPFQMEQGRHHRGGQQEECCEF